MTTHLNNPIALSLYKPQAQLFHRIKQSFTDGRPVVVSAGQRAGKTLIECALALDFEDVVVLFDQSRDHAEENFDLLREHRKKVRFEFALNFFGRGFNPQAAPGSVDKSHTITPDTLVLADEPFWWLKKTLPEQVFKRVSTLTKNVLFMGSKGPQSFTDTEVWHYGTWDLNPNFPRSAFAQHFADDPIKAQRDFGG